MKTKENVFSRYLTEDEEMRQFAHIYARRDAAWMQLLRHTGIRVGTLSGLTAADAKNAARDHSLTLRGEICKRGKGYIEPCNIKARKALRALLSIRREMGFVEYPDAPLVMSRKHQWLSVRSYQSRMQYWVEQAAAGEGHPPLVSTHRWPAHHGAFDGSQPAAACAGCTGAHEHKQLGCLLAPEPRADGRDDG